MNIMSRIINNVLTVLLFMALVASPGIAMKHEMGSGHGMTMHHQHITLNHALGMALEGSNLVMLGQMGMSPGIDEESVNHGKMMIKNGREMWNEVMSGETMKQMHGAGKSPSDDPQMKFTHELAEAQLKVIEFLSKHSDMTGHTMAVHHQHLMLNHALKMALEGSNLVMIGQMGMAPGIDEKDIDHGKMMIKNGRDLYDKIMSGETMTKMHKEGKTPMDDAGMKFTHELAEAELKVISLLESMQ